MTPPPSRQAAAKARWAERGGRVVHDYDVAVGSDGSATLRLTVPEGLDVAGAVAHVEGVGQVRFDPGTWTARLPVRPAGTRVRYRIDVVAADGRATPVDDAAPGLPFPTAGLPWLRPPSERFSYVVGARPTPDWVRDAVVYHVLIDRFAGPVRPARQIGFLAHGGGTIAGLTERLDHIAGLGCTAVLVSPPFPATMHVGYDATDLMAVDPRLGTVQDMRALCSACRERGLRVLLDFEASYLGGGHPAARDPARRHWFRWGPDGERLGWFGGSPLFIPLNHDLDDVRDHLVEAACFWLDVGVDGFRLDSAHDAPLDFWADFAARVPGVLVGEIIDDVTRWAGRMDGFFDFELANALRAFAAGESGCASRLDDVLRRRPVAGLHAFTFAENHDMDRVSFSARRDPRRGWLAHALLLSLPGTPVLYYGSEVGMQQRIPGDPAVVARAPMPWGSDQDPAVLTAFTELVARRRSSPALSHGRYETVEVGDRAKRLVFRRVMGDEAVTVEADARSPSLHVWRT